MAKEAIEEKTALQTFARMIHAQGGDERVISDPSLLKRAEWKHTVCAPESGYLYHMNTEAVGIASSLLGAGRRTKEDAIDYGAGIILERKTGDRVEKGEPLARFFASEKRLFSDAEAVFLQGMQIKAEAPEREPVILDRII